MSACISLKAQVLYLRYACDNKYDTLCHKRTTFSYITAQSQQI